MKLSEKTMYTIKQDAEHSINQLSKGVPAIVIAADLYCKSLTDKEPELGEVMAERIKSVVDSYTANSENALKDSEKWLEQNIDKMIEDKNVLERCTILYNMLSGILALNGAALNSDTEEFLKNQVSFDPGKASLETEEELRNQLIEALNNSTLGVAQLDAIAFLLNNNNGNMTQEIIDFAKNDRDIKIIMAMVAYINVKNGRIEEIPPEATLDEITIGVCFSYDTQRIALQVAEGKMEEKFALETIKKLAMVSGFMLAASLTLLSGSLINLAAVAFLPTMVAFPLTILCGAIIWQLAKEPSRNVCKKIIGFGWKIVKGGVGLIVKGLKAIAQFATQHVLPKCIGVYEKIKSYFARVKSEYQTKNENSQTEKEEVPATPVNA